MAEIKYLRPDLDVQPIRGNVDTRLNKVKKGEYAGIVIAEAGLERMNLEKEITERLSLEQFPSAAGQGAIAIVAKEGNESVIALLRSVEDKATRAEITAERSLVLELEGGCRVPIGAVAHTEGTNLSLFGCIFALNERKRNQCLRTRHISRCRRVGRKSGERPHSTGRTRI